MVPTGPRCGASWLGLIQTPKFALLGSGKWNGFGSRPALSCCVGTTKAWRRKPFILANVFTRWLSYAG